MARQGNFAAGFIPFQPQRRPRGQLREKPLPPFAPRGLKGPKGYQGGNPDVEPTPIPVAQSNPFLGGGGVQVVAAGGAGSSAPGFQFDPASLDISQVPISNTGVAQNQGMLPFVNNIPAWTQFIPYVGTGVT